MYFVYLDTKWYGYNRLRFLLESLKDLNNNLTLVGGHLHILQGSPVKIFQMIKEKIGLDFITFEQVLLLSNTYFIN